MNDSVEGIIAEIQYRCPSTEIIKTAIYPENISLYSTPDGEYILFKFECYCGETHTIKVEV